MALPKVNSLAPKAISPTVRTTVLLARTLDQNLEALALRQGSSKAEIVKQALTNFLSSSGLDPSRTPRINVSYES
jgi:hypothetical protein